MNGKTTLLLAVLAMTGMAFAAMTVRDLEPQNVQTAIAAKSVAERKAYMQQLITAISSLPIDDTEKVAKIVSAARAAIVGARKGGGGAHIIAEVFTSTPVHLLPAVKELLMRNFAQEVNKLSDEAYDRFCSQLIKNVSESIEISGTDSPAPRMALLASMFIEGASDPERVRSTFVAALPASVAPVAAQLVAIAEQRDTERMAATTGVDEIADTPSDPDKVVPVPQQQAEAAKDVTTPADADESTASNDAGDVADTVAAEDTDGSQMDYLKPEPPETAGPTITSEDNEDLIDVAVPLAQRMYADVTGIAMDLHSSVMFDWETAHDDQQDVLGRDVPIPTQIGVGDVTTIPGFAEYSVGVPVFLPSPSKPYGNQAF